MLLTEESLLPVQLYCLSWQYQLSLRTCSTLSCPEPCHLILLTLKGNLTAFELQRTICASGVHCCLEPVMGWLLCYWLLEVMHPIYSGTLCLCWTAAIEAARTLSFLIKQSPQIWLLASLISPTTYTRFIWHKGQCLLAGLSSAVKMVW